MRSWPTAFLGAAASREQNAPKKILTQSLRWSYSEIDKSFFNAQLPLKVGKLIGLLVALLLSATE